MLQFIVLGQVPGTHFQVTFGWFNTVFWPFMVIALFWLYKSQNKRTQQTAQRNFDVISLRSLEQA